jgi:hypothetical protein
MDSRTSAERADLLRVSGEILDAIRTKRAAAAARHLAETFVHRTERGVLTLRADFLAGIDGAGFHIEQLEFESIEADVFDGMAVVSGIQSARVRLEDGQVVEGRTAFTDIFVRAGAAWRLQAATSVEL